MQDRSPDRQLGRYQQVATLGQGGMGTVHLVLASGFGQFRKLLVIKELRQDLTCQKGFVRLFMDEAKLAARLEHPNVVQTFEAFQDGNRYLLAMEYLDGQALSALIVRLATEGVRLPLGMHIHILCEVLSGLHYAHELRDYDSSALHVVHRDVSPQNVFLTYHGAVKVVDFGVAKAANAALSNTPHLFVGKFSYAAPEQISGRPVDARTDVYAVGVMLWQAIAERRFSVGTPTPEATQARVEGAEPRIREVVPDVDPELADICDRAIEVDPDKRYPTAHAFRAALQAYLEVRDVHVHDAEIGQLMLRMFASDREQLHTQIEAAVEASRSSKAEAMTKDEREPTTKVDLSRAPELEGPHAADENYTSSNIMRLSRPEACGNASIPGLNKRVLQAGIAGLSVLALSSLVWLNAQLEPGSNVETKLLPATLVTSAVRPAAKPPAGSSARTTSVAPASSAPPPAPPTAAADIQKQNNKLPTPAAARPALAAVGGGPVRPPRHALQSPRTAAAPTEPTPVTSTPVPAKTEASPAAVEAGADLGVLRRTTRARIDVENPY